MGNRSYWKGKPIFWSLIVYCIVASLSISGCAPLQKSIEDYGKKQQLEENRKDMGQGRFEKIIFESKQILQIDETTPAAEVALYALGEVYAHHDFESRNYMVSQSYFERLIENFPESPLSSEAKVYISLFEAIAASEEAVAEKEESLQEAVLNANKKEYIRVNVPRKKIVKNKNFEEAVTENLQILYKSGGKKPADRAMYNLGLIYAHVDNPRKNYTKSKAYFFLLSEKYPNSEYAEEARIWLGLFETIDKLQQIDIELEQQKRKHTRQ